MRKLFDFRRWFINSKERRARELAELSWYDTLSPEQKAELAILEKSLGRAEPRFHPYP